MQKPGIPSGDPALEEALRLGMDTRALAPALTIGCRMRVPDETTRWAPENGRFRNLLIHQGKGEAKWEALFQEVHRPLQQDGLQGATQLL